MAARISWSGVAVGAVVGGILRVAVAALHFAAMLGEHSWYALLPAGVGLLIGGAAAATGRALLGAVVGAGLSFVFFLVALPVGGVAASLGAGTLPAVWEVLAVGAISGALGGAVGQVATRRKGSMGGR